MTQAIELKQKDFTIQLKYSEEAIEKKIMKFITPSGDSFEITSDEMINILLNQVNTDTLSPTFVDIEKMNVVEVSRQLECVLDEDLKKGAKIRLNYKHPYPIEFAIIEEVYKIAKINQDVPMVVLTAEYIEEAKKKIKPMQENFVKKFYKSFKQLVL